MLVLRLPVLLRLLPLLLLLRLLLLLLPLLLLRLLLLLLPPVLPLSPPRRPCARAVDNETRVTPNSSEAASTNAPTLLPGFAFMGGLHKRLRKSQKPQLKKEVLPVCELIIPWFQLERDKDQHNRVDKKADAAT
jgi:hypothetical protein